MSGDSRELAYRPMVEKAIEIYAKNPDVEHKAVAEMLGVSDKVLLRIRRSSDFWSKVYDYYMVTFEGDVVGVLKSMVREAKAGNVQAGRLVLEHSGKLQKNINVTVNSPYEKWLNKVKGVEDAEIVDEFQELPEEINDFSDLPPRKKEVGTWRARKEHKEVRSIISKEDKRTRRNAARKIMRAWQRRAKAVGVEGLPARRPTPGQRKAWEAKIIAAEKLASGSPQGQVGNNKTPCKPKNQKQEVPKTPTPPKT